MGRLLPAGVVLAAFTLYAVTLAPGLLWGDSAKFQRMALQGELRFDETGHPIWVALAHPLTLIPGVDPAMACNLFSALLSALALWPAFRLMRRFGASPPAATLACLALAVSHTFWYHAVVTEVYSLNSLVTLTLLDLITSERRLGAWVWALAGLVAAVAWGNHLQVILWLPGYLWWMRAARREGRISLAEMALAASGFVVGILPFVVLRMASARSGSFFSLVGRVLGDAVAPSAPANDALQFAGYLLYQFPVPLMLAAAVAGVVRMRRERPSDMVGLLILYATLVVFTFSYRVPDRFAFYLPSYLILALLAAPGLDALLPGRRARFGAWVGWGLAAAACVIAPPIVYQLSPAWIGSSLLSRFPSARVLPYRDAIRYHLDPVKLGETGARRFCLEALSTLPPRAVVIADYTVNEPLNYMQLAEGLRLDVDVYYVLPARQLQVALDLAAQSRPVFIAARDSHYAVEALSTRFEIRPAGPIYELFLR